MDIISTYREIGTYRGAAEVCGTTHKTVKRAVERAEQDPPEPQPRPHNYDAVRELVAERVTKSAGRISAKRLLPIARAAGYDPTLIKLASLGRFALHRDDRKFRVPVAVANGVRSALVQQQGDRRFMLEGVSVDPGCTMLPVSPQISLRVESPYPRGPWNVAVEHECQNSVSPRSPRNTHLCQSC
jgi:hypothetical protein